MEPTYKLFSHIYREEDSGEGAAAQKEEWLLQNGIPA